MKRQLLFYTFLISFIGNSQLSDGFSDGDFTSNPTWSGTTADFVINSNDELQTNLSIPATSFLSTPHLLTSLDDKEWRMRVKMSFSPSSANYGRIYLVANNNDPTTDPDGFYLQLGESGSVDAVSLYKQVGGVSNMICQDQPGTIATSFDYGIKVNRDATGLWTLSVDPTGGMNFVPVASGTDAAVILGTHFAWQCVYTSSNASKFYLDDVFVGDIPVDAVAPILISAIVVDQNHVDVLFNEALDQTVAETSTNYSISPFNSASAAVLDGSDPKLVHLTTLNPLVNGTQYTLYVANAEDIAGNDTTNMSTSFDYIIPEQPTTGDVVINEFFADPSPVVGLPELEFVEIYNRSNKFFDLTGWKLGDASGEGTVVSGILAPNEYRVLCANSSLPSFVGASGVTSFPSLNNASDDIVLLDTAGVEIDKISYTDDWYQSTTKSTGGYSIERINPTLVCSSAKNWIASSNVNGGTPGVQNSVFDNTPDTDKPTIINTFTSVPNVLTIEFSEPMDAVVLLNASLATTPNLTEINRGFTSTQPSQMILTYAPDFEPSVQYDFELTQVEDCAGNQTDLVGSFILPDAPLTGEVVINEILFDPVTGGQDYVELYNTSGKVFDLFEWVFANFDDDTISNEKMIQSHFILWPGEYVVVSKDSNQVKEAYPNHGVGQFVKSDLPNYSNDEGTVILKTATQELDRVEYSDEWHFSLLDSKDGKSLERINALDESNNPSNWHTASESVAFGTPGLENSQYIPMSETGEFELPNKVFSPDNDGFEDVLQMRYKMAENGMLANVHIYDDNGRLIRKLSESELLSTEGVLSWDGVTDEGIKASIGQYIIVFEAFNSNGGSQFFDRKVCVLAGRL